MRSGSGGLSGHTSILEGVQLGGEVSVCVANGLELVLKLLDLSQHLSHGVIWLRICHGFFSLQGSLAASYGRNLD